jgi:hypothetical protein
MNELPAAVRETHTAVVFLVRSNRRCVVTTTNQLDTNELLVMRPADIEAQPARPVPGCPGVAVKELWRSGDQLDMLIVYLPGAATPGCPHPGADHHIWVIRGSALIAGQPVGAGSYVHVPPCVSHPILAIDPLGCVLLQVHRPIPADGARG